MARNQVQFQKGISLNEFLSQYGTEEQCFNALYTWRWPEGFRCPNCNHDKYCQLTSNKLQQCHRCHQQTYSWLESRSDQDPIGNLGRLSHQNRQ